MTVHERLITNDMAYAASLRHWGKHDANRVALAVLWGRYSGADARAELATTLAWYAQRAGIRSVSCRWLAACMLDDELTALEAHHNAVLQRMIRAAEEKLRANPRDLHGAMNAAVDIAEAANAVPELIDKAMGIAQWRIRKGHNNG